MFETVGKEIAKWKRVGMTEYKFLASSTANIAWV